MAPWRVFILFSEIVCLHWFRGVDQLAESEGKVSVQTREASKTLEATLRVLEKLALMPRVSKKLALTPRASEKLALIPRVSKKLAPIPRV